MFLQSHYFEHLCLFMMFHVSWLSPWFSKWFRKTLEHFCSFKHLNSICITQFYFSVNYWSALLLNLTISSEVLSACQAEVWKGEQMATLIDLSQQQDLKSIHLLSKPEGIMECNCEHSVLCFLRRLLKYLQPPSLPRVRAESRSLSLSCPYPKEEKSDRKAKAASFPSTQNQQASPMKTKCHLSFKCPLQALQQLLLLWGKGTI